MRINQYLAKAGFGSRRSCEELVTAGRVRVNGEVITELATKVGPEDLVQVGRKKVAPIAPIYVLFHKPRGAICSAADEKGRRTIYDYLSDDWKGLRYVGRLDQDSEGLLLLTNDGSFIHGLTHPKNDVEKEYLVSVDKSFDAKHLPRLLKGTLIEGKLARAKRVALNTPTTLRIILVQGIKRQIRVMLFRLGYETKRLKRERLGPLTLGKLPAGAARLLTAKELHQLQTLAQPQGTSLKKTGF
ncbi:MAG: pseudouridine synthase [Verrucomicrobiales bacterium]